MAKENTIGIIGGGLAERERWASFVSGGGTTMAHMIESISAEQIPLDIGCIISSVPRARAIQKALNLGVSSRDIIIVNPNDFRNANGKIDRDRFGEALLVPLEERGVTIVTQNGWLPYTPENVIDRFTDRIFNQHPGPKYETKALHGTQPHAAMLYIANATGRNLGTHATVHRVDKYWDHGETVGFIRVPIEDIEENPKELQKRVLPLEHTLQVILLKTLAEGFEPATYDEPVYIQEGEEEIIEAAKKYARQMYPNG